MKVNKKFMQNISFMSSFFAIFVFIVSLFLTGPLVASASVPDENVFFDYDKYSTYTYDSTTGNIHAVVSTPQDWFYSALSTNLVDYTVSNSNIITTNYDSFNYLAFRANPWFNYFTLSGQEPITNGRFMDLSYIPRGSMLSFDFKVTTNQPFVEDVINNFYLIYVDSSGNVVGQKSLGVTPIDSGVVNGATVYDYTCMFPLGSTDIPDSAKGFYLHLGLNINYGGRSGFVGVNFDYIKLHFHYSQLNYNSNNEVIIRDKLSNIEDALGDVLNGTPQQNQQAQDAIGGLNNSTDKLGQLGDSMASVDKPTIDSNQISADKLVPDTSLTVLSSPFQALWENNQLLAMLTIVVTLVLVSWVFFGKKA